MKKLLLLMALCLLPACDHSCGQATICVEHRRPIYKVRYICVGLSEDEKGSFKRAFDLWNGAIHATGHCVDVAEAFDTEPTLIINKVDLPLGTLGIEYAGHISINAKYRFHCGAPHGCAGLDADLDGLALHEVGHYFFLKHSDNPNDCMWKNLHSESHWLHEGDKEKIRKIYATE